MSLSRILLVFTIFGWASITLAAPNPKEVEAQVVSAVSRQLNIKTDKVITQSRIEDLGGDEFDIVDIAHRLEKQYSISLSDSEIDSVSRVDDFTQIIVSKVK